jgi:DNA-binding LacI/PurR family transcriptional regulator
VDFYSSEVAELVRSDLPCVTIDHTFENRCSIVSDNVNGMRMLVERAVALGHRRIAYIHGQKRNSAVTENRIRGFYRAMEDNGLALPEGYVVPGRYDDFESIREDLLALLDRPDRPSCIMLPDDASYFGALDTIRARGLQVPGDISLAGYDGVRSVQAVRPRLTTVRQDSDAMGRQAALRLIGQIDRPNAFATDSVLIPATLIEGESLAAVPEGHRE